ncbi:glycoside hydrolase family 130 protein [Flavobacterium cellulosilyticum]|uniref:Pesticidal protein Cry7Aa n=1 Tax=Flavobacterium cellulosilyticum TaxID=2541731 RepID=A0A4R5CI74_9FLAO|nr:pesticidal protein Cry7Aa [Flavobacterium cellulosilyticum]TDD97034.1 pesticidal protein Cry7Aa [Flavobacterium cellulosilyticum]
MITIEKHGILLSPTENEFENNAVLNPGIFQEGNTVHIFYRAVQNGNFSTIGYAKSDGPMNIVERLNHPLIKREFDYENHGLEDPRIVKIEDVYYLTYTAYDSINITGAFATSKDLIHFEKHGIITPEVNYQEYESHVNRSNPAKLNPKYHQYYNLFSQIGIAGDKNRLLRDKDVVLFPRKINGQFVLLHRIWPGIQIVKFDKWEDLTLSFWEDYLRNLTDHIILDPKDAYEMNYIGAGVPPIETKDGWLLIYHGVHETTTGKIYHAKAALLHLEKPEIEISRLPYPLFSPAKQWEMEGLVDNVVFPTGSSLFGNELFVYYGAADKHIAVAKMDINELLLELRKQP